MVFLVLEHEVDRAARFGVSALRLGEGTLVLVDLHVLGDHLIPAAVTRVLALDGNCVFQDAFGKEKAARIIKSKQK